MGSAAHSLIARSARLVRAAGTGAVLLPLALLSVGLALSQVRPAPSRPLPNPGYLGVSLLDLDPDTAVHLRLKDTRGALIVTIDREAPAAAAGLRPHDVILEMNSQRIDNVDQLRRRLHDTPAGSTITLRVSREADASQQVISVQLGDQVEIARRAWEQHFAAAGLPTGAGDPAAAGPAADADVEFVPPSGRRGPASSFLGVFSINSLYTGAELDPLSTQLAEYFGVHDGAGLLVRSVNDNSPAASAGLHAGDVILRVNNKAVVSRADWIKQLHANRGRPVLLYVMRNRHEQTMNMVAGKKN